MTESPAQKQPVATWFRYCLLVTAIFNLFGTISFLPPVYYPMVNILGLPEATPFGLWVIASWIFIFGAGYAWMFVTAKPERLFVGVAAACKITIALCFCIFWLTGDFPLISLFVGCSDFLLAGIFIFWLLQSDRKVHEK